MKNGKRIAIATVIAVVFLVACGGRTDETMASGEIVVPEMSSEDLLVSSLEYLLMDDDTQEEEQDWLRQANVQNDLEKSNDTVVTDTVQEPDQEQGETVTIYYGNGGSFNLKEETIVIEEKTADELISALAKHNIVSLDTKVLSFGEEKEADATILYLNLSNAAGEYLRTMSREAECIIIASVVNTFVENYDADGIYLMVDDKPLSTPNAEYTQALGKCMPDELLKKFGESDANASQEQEIAEPDETDSEDDSANEVQSKLPIIQEKE